MKKKLIIFFILNTLSFFNFFITSNSNIIFFCLWIMCFLIIVKAKFSLFSSTAVIVSYITIPVYFQENYGHSYGILELNTIPLYSKEIYLLILLFLDIIWLFVQLSKILAREKKLYRYDYNVTNLVFYLSCVGSIFFAIVAFPRFPFVESNDDRFSMLLPGHAWNHLALVFMLICTTRFMKSHLARISIAFTIFWFLSHGERVDMIGYFLGVVIYYFNKHKIKTSDIIILLLIGLFVVISFNLIGFRRQSQQANISNIVYNLIVQKTAADLAYVFNSSIHLAYTSKLYYGLTYSTYLFNLIPMASTPYLPEAILQKAYNTAGGEFILCEPVINFGLYGILLFELFEIFLLYLLLSEENTRFFRSILMFIVFTQFRILWYGRTYIMTSIFGFIPILLFLNYLLSSKVYERADYCVLKQDF